MRRDLGIPAEESDFVARVELEEVAVLAANADVGVAAHDGHARDLGAHQRLTSSGLVQALRADPLNVHLMTISRSDLSSIDVRLMVAGSLPFFAIMGLLLVFELFDEPVQFLEARIPDLTIALEPMVKLAKGLCA